jgi:hypothetical protein
MENTYASNLLGRDEMPPKEAIVTPGPNGPRVTIGDNGMDYPWQPPVQVDPKHAVQAWISACENEKPQQTSANPGNSSKPEEPEG